MKPFKPYYNILGVHLSIVNMESTLRNIVACKEEFSGEYICVSNVHTTIMSYENPDYLSIQNNAAMVLPDGGPLSYFGRKSGYKDMGRVTGPNVMGEIFRLSKSNDYSHFFFGSTEETLEKLREQLSRLYPQIQIAGTYSPPFGCLDSDDKEIIEVIRQSSADFIWVGLGAPKQEIWMAKHRKLFPGVMIGVGAGFDYYAGNIKRAPSWMQKWSLEWLYRLLQEPRRLFGRYFKTNIMFLYLMFTKQKEYE